MKKNFSWRIFISFGLSISFLIILVSGVILYIAPSGRGPGRTAWILIGLTKSGWQNQHIIFGFAFSFLALFHLFLINWKAFYSYLKTKTPQSISRNGELLLIGVLTLLFVFGTYYEIQPFTGILEFGKSISKSWGGEKMQLPKGVQGSENGLSSRSKPRLTMFQSP